ncbi:FkbM family methyltransferase [Mumia sp. DW29H23]|uniref:FkbM family methyltransferase n=1 Tax=Mumia sp. DW29H23 TaxID=3421241 RepID=UPI003D697328
MLRRLPAWRGKARATRIAARVLPPDACVRRIHDDAGFDYLVDLRSRTEAGVFANGPDDFVAPVLSLLMQPGDLVLDIGANVGLVTLPLAAAARRTGASVIAVEPIPTNHSRLVDAVRLNGFEDLVTTVHTALADAPGRTTMSVDRDAPTGNAYLRTNRHDPAMPTFEVAVRTLDDLLDEVAPGRSASLVKIDVEGAEMLVLGGAQLMLAEHRPVILGEFNSGLMPAFGHTFLDVAAALEPLGYKPYAFVAGPRVVPIVPEVGRGDVLWIPAERELRVVSAINAAASGARAH